MVAQAARLGDSLSLSADTRGAINDLLKSLLFDPELSRAGQGTDVAVSAGHAAKRLLWQTSLQLYEVVSGNYSLRFMNSVCCTCLVF